MDARGFDNLTRGVASAESSRRSALRSFAALSLAAVLGLRGARAATAQTVAPSACTREGKECRRPDDCCSGSCERGVCAGLDDGNQKRFFVRARGKGQPPPDGCERTAQGCSNKIDGKVLRGTPIDRGTFDGNIIQKGFVPTGSGGFTAETSGRISVRDTSGDRLLLRVAGVTEGQADGSFIFEGRYRIIKGFGAYQDAKGAGDARATGTAAPGDAENPITLTLRGII